MTAERGGGGGGGSGGGGLGWGVGDIQAFNVLRGELCRNLNRGYSALLQKSTIYICMYIYIYIYIYAHIFLKKTCSF